MTIINFISIIKLKMYSFKSLINYKKFSVNFSDSANLYMIETNKL